MRRRRLLAMGATAVSISGCLEIDAGGTTVSSTETPESPTETVAGMPTTAKPPADATTRIGGSLHGRPHRIADDLGLLTKSETSWMHAFLDVRKKYEGDVAPSDDPDVAALRQIKRETDVDLIVSLKWNFTGNFGHVEGINLPPSGSDYEQTLIEYATELLLAIDEPVDMIVLGNEPVWETPDADVLGDDMPFLQFTRTVKEHLLRHYTVGDPKLLLGAFNRLYDAVWDEYEGFYRRLFELARTDDDIDGIDLHVHYASLSQAERMLDVARRQFPDGTMTATEFSPVFRYGRNTAEPIASFDGGDAFADRYGIDNNTTVVEYLEAAKDDRLPWWEISAFYETMQWYNVNFVEDMYRLLDAYDVEVGTFGFLVEDDVRHVDWTEDWSPFPINCLFQPALIDTEDGAHPHYIDDFRNRA